MKNDANSPNSWRYGHRRPGGRQPDPPWITLAALCLVILVIFWSCCATLIITGCTVTPTVVKEKQGSFDLDPATGRQEENSGLLGHDAQGNGIITLHALDRYNALIDKYGKRFDQPLVHNQGITLTSTNTALIQPEALFYFMTMNRWRHLGVWPPPADAGK